jgi:hypothetical protein
MTEAVAAYLAALRASLPPGLGARRTDRILREIEEHILEGWADEQAHGAAPDEALRRVFERFGPPDVIAMGFTAVVDERRVRVGRCVLVAGLCASFLVVGVSLLRYPAIAGTPNASLSYLLLCAAILGLYGWVGLDAARSSSPAAVLALWHGIGAGLLTSVLLFAVTGIADLALAILWRQGPAHFSSATLLPIDHRIEELALGGPTITGFMLTIMAGASVAARTGRIATGAQVGLWSGMLTALGLVLTSLVLNNTLADVLSRTQWSHDPTCAVSHASALAACEVGDTLGGAASMLLLLPLMWVGLGILGGLFGRTRLVRAHQPSLGFVRSLLAGSAAITADTVLVQGARIRSLMLFSAAMITTFVVALVAHLW